MAFDQLLVVWVGLAIALDQQHVIETQYPCRLMDTTQLVQHHWPPWGLHLFCRDGSATLAVCAWCPLPVTVLLMGLSHYEY